MKHSEGINASCLFCKLGPIFLGYCYHTAIIETVHPVECNSTDLHGCKSEN